jgi:hypothetical protein
MRGASHSFVIRSRTPSVDAEGQISYANSDSTVKGRVMIRNADAVEGGGSNSFQAEAIAWVPVGTTVSDADQIVVSGQDPLLNGTYNIQGIQHTPMHYRCFLLGARS